MLKFLTILAVMAIFPAMAADQQNQKAGTVVMGPDGLPMLEWTDDTFIARAYNPANGWTYIWHKSADDGRPLKLVLLIDEQTRLSFVCPESPDDPSFVIHDEGEVSVKYTYPATARKPSKSERTLWSTPVVLKVNSATLRDDRSGHVVSHQELPFKSSDQWEIFANELARTCRSPKP